MPSSFDVCIRGDGVVGRTLALLLAQARLRVALVGREPGAAAPEHTDVRAYALNTASRQTLAALRAWPDAQHATPVRQMQVCGDDGGRVEFKSPAPPAAASSSQAGALAWIVDVAPLHRLLVEAARYQPQIETVTEPVAAALTVICEGRRGHKHIHGHSHSHEELDVQWTISPYPQDAIAFVTDGLQGLFAQPGAGWQALRNRGMNTFTRSGPIKTWLTRRAAGL